MRRTPLYSQLVALGAVVSLHTAPAPQRRVDVALEVTGLAQGTPSRDSNGGAKSRTRWLAEEFMARSNHINIGALHLLGHVGH